MTIFPKTANEYLNTWFSVSNFPDGQVAAVNVSRPDGPCVRANPRRLRLKKGELSLDGFGVANWTWWVHGKQCWK